MALRNRTVLHEATAKLMIYCSLGDTFSTGDVLLEIETDKATIDVEAQDDGVVAKITQPDGSKGIKVGSRIAILAESGDDVSSVEMPPDEVTADSPAAKEFQSSSSSSSTRSQGERTPSTSSEENGGKKPESQQGGMAQQQTYPLYPSVQHLFRTSDLSDSEASKIPATGPNGRLLKGDVLSFLGQIGKSYSSQQSERISSLGHLDLSNIKKKVPEPPKETEAAKKETAPKDGKKEDNAPAEPPVEDVDTQIALPISLSAVYSTQNRIQEALGLTLPLSTFIARASELANEDLPRTKKGPPSSEELFDSVLGLDKVPGVSTSRGTYLPQVTALGPPAGGPSSIRAQSSSGADIIDVLAGIPAAKQARRRQRSGAMGVVSRDAPNVFSVNVRKGEERRARTYLERVKTVLESEPGRCVL